MDNKCKICGVDIEAHEGERIDICENCRARQAEATPACEQREQAPQDADVQAQAANPAVYIAPLLKRAYDFLQSRNFVKADEYFERVLDIDLNNDEALLGKLLVEGGVTELSAFESTTRAVYMAKSYGLIMSHGSEELKGKINALCEKIDENVFVKGDQFLKSRNFKTAIEAYKRYIKRRGKSKAAILGLLLATYKVSSVEELSKGTASIKENGLYLALLSSDDEKLKNELTAASEKIEARRKRIKSKLILSAIITASVAVVTAVSIIIGVAIYRSSDEYVYDLEEGKGGYIIGDFKDDDPIEGGHLEVPKELGGGNVVAIDAGAFKDREDITSVYIPDEIKEIGKGAFSGCESITEINIPFLGKNEADTVNNTLNHIFDGNIPKSLKRVTVRGGSIGEKAFFGCGQIESVTLPSGIKTIGASTFSGCSSLKSIKLPSGVTSIGISAFKGCSSLGKVTLPSGIKSVGEGAFEGCTGITEVVIPKSLESMGFGAFKGCTGMTRIELPFVGNDRGSTVSPRLSYAFGAMDSSLISVVMPKGLKTVVLTDIEQIPNFAFAECNLISTVIIPEGVVTICDYAFYKCTDIKEISVPASVKTIGKGAFKGCLLLDKLELNNGLEDIGNHAFEECESLMSLEIPSTVKTIGGSAFASCLRLESVKIAVQGCTVGYNAFSYCGKLQRVELSGIEVIGEGAFKDCTSIGELILPNGIKTIGDGAFEGCTGITEVVIPKSLKGMGFGAFKGCTGMTRIELPFVGNNRGGTKSTRFSYAFGATDSSLISAVMPKGLKTVVLTDIEQIPNFAFAECNLISTVIIPDGVVTIGEYAFYKCTDIEEVSILTSVKTIGKGAFSYCGKLQRVELSGVEIIGEGAFMNCALIGELTLPNGIKTIGEGAFEGCTGIAAVVIPKSLESMGFGAFKGCTGVTRIELPFVGNDRGSTVSPRLSYAFGAMDSNLISAVMPKGLKTVVLTDIGQIPNFAFAECNSISTVIIPDGVVKICDYAFYKCTDIKEISIPASVKTIGKGAFRGCLLLDKLELNNGLEDIGNYAFEECESLRGLEIPSTVKTIGGSAFASCLRLESVKIVAQGCTVGYNAFSYCGKLQRVELSGVVRIGEGAFRDNELLTEIIIPSTVTTIDKYAFSGCTSLTSITIPIEVIYVGEGAFEGCRLLTVVCEAESKPSGWSDDWCLDLGAVQWGKGQD